MVILKKKKLLEQEEEKYYCRLCDKRFSSGRALGGHMRVHEMFNIQHILHQNEGSSTTGTEGESSDDNRHLTSHICQNCCEEFCSLKSLSKHCFRGHIGAGGDDGENDISNGLFTLHLPDLELLLHLLCLPKKSMSLIVLFGSPLSVQTL
ncbi:zinc finger protein ZAT6-like [Dendrobium catenatum]|uniref:zinc finger protein ZAT6-like n=1 Tax=Dendrobium catenatum TaxID=906689 RepID=UPI0009F7297C|nr:zinc finger protein ZAT6-like [Dendrobium catenatum]